MKRKTVHVLALGCAVAVGGLMVTEVQAIVGRPLTPVSYAGVARRTTRRVIVATSMYVPKPPPTATVVVIEGTTLYKDGNTYYQASGSQYVVVNVQ